MKYLLDTHILIWALTETARLSDKAKGLLSSDAEFCFSPVSLWEISIKHARHPLQMSITSSEARDLAFEAGLSELKVDSRHGVEIANLPDVHADPFDRMLVAQARVEGAFLITHDNRIALYDAPVILV